MAGYYRFLERTALCSWLVDQTMFADGNGCHFALGARGLLRRIPALKYRTELTGDYFPPYQRIKRRKERKTNKLLPPLRYCPCGGANTSAVVRELLRLVVLSGRQFV